MLVGGFKRDPKSELLTIWTDEFDGQNRLFSRVGLTPGCVYPRFLHRYAIVLGPEGVPANVIRAINECDDDAPIEGWTVELDFSDELDQELTWDPSQVHPHLPPVETDHNGEAAFSILGGGCAEVGNVSVRVNGVAIALLPGANSPDVDGDCLVELEDLTMSTRGSGPMTSAPI